MRGGNFPCECIVAGVMNAWQKTCFKEREGPTSPDHKPWSWPQALLLQQLFRELQQLIRAVISIAPKDIDLVVKPDEMLQ